MNLPLVSIVITAYNEEKNIENCLRSIKNQTYSTKKIEIIVVDNNSTDRTVEIARRYTNKIYNTGPERSAQRNFGVQKAKGKYILYLDADMILSKNVISQCAEKFRNWKLEIENSELVALYIPERIIGKGFWIKVRDFERSFYNATVIDCVRFVQRDKFLEIGGFDKNLTGPEDWDFDRRIKATGKVDIIDAPLYHNEGEFNLKEYLKKKSYYSQSSSKYLQKWGRNDPIIKKQFGFWYRLFGVFMENKKWKGLLRHPLLTSDMYLLKLAVGLVYLKRR